MNNFYDSKLNLAKVTSGLTGIKISVILALLAHESAYGTSKLARDSNNFSGISDSDGKLNPWSKGSSLRKRPSNEGGWYVRYDSVEDYAFDLAHVLNLSYYQKVRNAKTAQEQITELGKSPYAVDPRHGDKIMAIWKKDGLYRYDGEIIVEEKNNFKETIENKAKLMSNEELSKMAMVGVGFAVLVSMLDS